MAFVHALRKGQEQGQQAYLFPDALIKLEEQRDFLGGPLTVEERQRRYELDFAFRETEQFRIADQIVAVRVVVRKGNEDPDVVQQGGIVQQLARYGRGVVQPMARALSNSSRASFAMCGNVFPRSGRTVPAGGRFPRGRRGGNRPSADASA